MELNERTWGAKWCASMVKAQAKFPRIGKDKEVTVSTVGKGSYTYDYTPLDVLVDKTKETLEQNELGVFQDTWVEDGFVYVRTTIFHASGEFREFAALCYPMPNGRIHDLGSLLSYLRRYSYLSALRLAPSDASDDDGKRIQEGEQPQWNHKPLGETTPTLSAKLFASNFKAAFENDDVLKAGALHKDLHAEGEEAYRNAWALLDSKCRTWVKKAIEATKEVA
jgi:hypothetical protein